MSSPISKRKNLRVKERDQEISTRLKSRKLVSSLGGFFFSSSSFDKKFFFIYLFLFLNFFGCVGSLLLCVGFL